MSLFASYATAFDLVLDEITAYSKLHVRKPSHVAIGPGIMKSLIMEQARFCEVPDPSHIFGVKIMHIPEEEVRVGWMR